MIIEENGILYNIDDDGLVTEASTVSEPDVIAEELNEEFRIGDRVEADNELGTVISIISSVYGPAFGVRFDDQTIDEFSEDRLTHVDIDAPDYETPVKEVISRYAAYQELPAYTKKEIETKSEEGRWLNLRAKSLITDSKLPLSDQIELDTIVLATGTDLYDFKNMASVEDEAYTDLLGQSRFSIPDQFQSRATLASTEDASWVESGFEDMEQTTDADLALRAEDMVSKLPEDKLDDKEFISLAASYQADYLFATEEQEDHFNKLVDMAVAARLAQRKTPEEKTAAVEDDLDNFDTSALYI